LGDISIADISSTESAQPRRFQLAQESSFRLHTLSRGGGVAIKALPNGCIYAIEHGDIVINQVLASPVAGGIHRIYLRIIENGIVRFAEIVGPNADSVFTARVDQLSWRGTWQGLDYHCTCDVPRDGNSWVFQIQVQNTAEKTVICDAVLVQDIGLATRGHIRSNERFTSQYLDHAAIQHAQFGHFLLTRQNLPQLQKTCGEDADPVVTHPWLLQTCLPMMVGFTTDGLDFFGSNFRETGSPKALHLPTIGNRVRQHEAGYTAIQAGQVELSQGQATTWAFFSMYSPDHPEPSSASDITDQIVQNATKSHKSAHSDSGVLLVPAIAKKARSLFQCSPLFVAAEFTKDEIKSHFAGSLRHEEFVQGSRHSFFVGDDSRHVVLKSKEIALDRQHGHIMRAGQGLMPDAEVMSCTFYAAGIFASQMAVGNTVFGKFIAGVRDPLNIIQSSGLRIFIRRHPEKAWELLAVPSAFEMAPSFCRWYYKFDSDLLTVTCNALAGDPTITYDVRTRETAAELLICGEISAGGHEYDSAPTLIIDARKTRLTIIPDRTSLLAQKQPEISLHAVSSTPHAIDAIGGDELLGSSGRSSPLPYFVIRTRPTTHFSLSFLGTFDDPIRTESLCEKYGAVVEDSSHLPRTMPAGNSNGRFHIFAAGSQRASELQDAMVWMARDALVHFSIPRGLEQSNGGAWGVRDVCQGPVEFLLSQNHPEIVRAVICQLFSQQYDQTGDWPQWFMFPPFQEVQARVSHGDIVIWPLKALCDYLEDSDDGDILHQELPYTDEETFRRTASVESLLHHADKLIARIRSKCLPELALPAYGEGDWDDSLQPVSKERAERTVSSWTTALLYQTLQRYSASIARHGQPQRAAEIAAFAEQVHVDFHCHLMPDGVVAGFAVFGDVADQVEYLLHPRDAVTGLRYRLISMTRGIISGIFSREQAGHHLQLIKQHLLYPDGARLMDRPTFYRGGEERIFRRSESASFFGREIGLQYIHAHLRYAEALAALGNSEDFLHALLVASPISVTQVVDNAQLRQRNCYFSSSDAMFQDRYEAARDYCKLKTGDIPVAGGWRVYSSGPGIYLNLVIRHLLGIRNYCNYIDFDPVIPPELSGVCCDFVHAGRKLRCEIHRQPGDGVVKRILINGTDASLSGTRILGRYRSTGIRIPKATFELLLTAPENFIRVEL
jgi:cellobiose phosphorylase